MTYTSRFDLGLLTTHPSPAPSNLAPIQQQPVRSLDVYSSPLRSDHAPPSTTRLGSRRVIAPVHVLFKDDGSYPPEIGRFSSDVGNGTARVKTRLTRSLAVIRSTCTNLLAPRLPAPRVRKPGSPMLPISDPNTSTNESADTAPCSPKNLH